MRLKRDWLTGGFVPYGGIGSFLPVVRPGTPRAGQQPRVGASQQTGVGEQISDSQPSDQSPMSRSHFGVQLKLDKIDGLLRDGPSIHEWLSPRERHERNLARRPKEYVESHVVGSTQLSSSVAVTELGQNEKENTQKRQQESDAPDGEPPCEWTPAEEDLVITLFPGALPTQ